MIKELPLLQIYNLHYYKMLVQFISHHLLDYWIHCFFTDSLSLDQWIHYFFIGPCSLQLVNSLEIQWNHLTFKELHWSLFITTGEFTWNPMKSLDIQGHLLFPVHYNWWIHLKSNEITWHSRSFIGPCSLQLVNSLEIQWNHLTFKDTSCWSVIMPNNHLSS
jgi:hypothetical protein